MLSIQQRDLLALLEDFQCLRRTHIERYLNHKHRSTQKHVDAMIRQLRVMGKIMISEGYIKLPYRKENQAVIEAFDVMMDLTNGIIDTVFKGSDVFTLVFTVLSTPKTNEANAKDGGQYKTFAVVPVKPLEEENLCRRLEGIAPEITVIFILDSIEQQYRINIKSKCFFALRSEKGQYKFFKTTKKM